MALLIRPRLNGGSFGELEKAFGGETDQERADRLEDSSGELLYMLMVSYSDVSEIRESHGDLTYQLMMKGVL